MQFGDLNFWLAFAVFYVVYLLVHKRVEVRNVLLLLASYFFYALWSGQFVALLLFSTAVAYGTGTLLSRLSGRRKKMALWSAIALFLCILAGYKYAFFFLGVPMTGTSLLLPIGISFYTFQIVGYLVDVYRGTIEPERSPLRFALYIAFFPKILSGPIERASHFLPQLRHPQRIGKASISEGFYLVVWGLVQKFCIADNAAVIEQILFYRHRTDMAYAMSGPLAVALMIYANFSGYSDIAKGIASLLGFELSWNFRMPYASTNPGDFWKRWHISLSEWFRDYVYIPLGGSRAGMWRTALHLLITMSLVGLWHGAKWTFVLWGLYQGLLLVAYRLLALLRGPPIDSLRLFLRRTGLSWLIFFVLTVIGWLLFQSENVDMFRDFMDPRRLVTIDAHMPMVLLLWAPIIVMHIFQRRQNDDLLALPNMSRGVQLTFYFLAFYGLLFLPPLNQLQDFIYVLF